jgi:ATP-dependent RNA helicase DHX8/PRP22
VVVPGRQFPVSILYTPEPEPEFLDAALIACLQVSSNICSNIIVLFDRCGLAQIHEEEEPGGVLVFLPGQEEIESLTLLLQDHLPSVHPQHPLTVAPQASSSVDVTEEQDGSKTVGVANLRDFLIRPLYAAMPPDEQLRVFEPAPQGVRKFILATNIAETSVTISGVKYGESLPFSPTSSHAPLPPSLHQWWTQDL